jgi:hypothetical protein
LLVIRPLFPGQACIATRIRSPRQNRTSAASKRRPPPSKGKDIEPRPRPFPWRARDPKTGHRPHQAWMTARYELTRTSNPPLTVWQTPLMRVALGIFRESRLEERTGSGERRAPREREWERKRGSASAYVQTGHAHGARLGSAPGSIDRREPVLVPIRLPSESSDQKAWSDEMYFLNSVHSLPVVASGPGRLPHGESAGTPNYADPKHRESRLQTNTTIQ